MRLAPDSMLPSLAFKCLPSAPTNNTALLSPISSSSHLGLPRGALSRVFYSTRMRSRCATPSTGNVMPARCESSTSPWLGLTARRPPPAATPDRPYRDAHRHNGERKGMLTMRQVHLSPPSERHWPLAYYYRSHHPPAAGKSPPPPPSTHHAGLRALHRPPAARRPTPRPEPEHPLWDQPRGCQKAPPRAAGGDDMARRSQVCCHMWRCEHADWKAALPPVASARVDALAAASIGEVMRWQAAAGSLQLLRIITTASPIAATSACI